jgi:hypothetical protein
MAAAVGRRHAVEADGMLQVAGLVHLDVEAKLVEEARVEHLLLLLARQRIGPAKERHEVALVLVDGANLPEMA